MEEKEKKYRDIAYVKAVQEIHTCLQLFQLYSEKPPAQDPPVLLEGPDRKGLQVASPSPGGLLVHSCE